MSSRFLGKSAQVMVMVIVVSVMLLLAGVGALALIHFCIVRWAFRRGSSAVVGGERSDEASGGLSADDLEKLPSYDYTAGEKGSGPGECAVCLENFQMGDRCRLLPVCKHNFHTHCVDSWLSKMPICPMCRASADHRKAGEGHPSRFGSGGDHELNEISSGGNRSPTPDSTLQ